MRCARAAAVLLVASACASPPRIKLEAPASDAPVVERIAAYEKLSARRVTPPMSKKISREPFERGHEEIKLPPHLLLQDGREIRAPDDLLPVVWWDSATAASARRSIEARDRADAGWAVAACGPVVGLATALSGLSFEPDSTGRSTLLVTGLAVTVIAMATGGILGFGNQASASRSASEAFRSYDDDLLERLALCRDGDAVAACAER
ncbi:MAG: hypothetical protein RIT81_13415 [Deltaproteobacteria bacterium]